MRKLLLTPVLVLALFAGLSSPARAAPPPTPGNGNLTAGIHLLQGGFIPGKVAGNNQFFQASWTGQITGILSGMCSANESGVTHLDPSGNPTGGNTTGTATCNGTAAGQPAGQTGTFSFDYVTNVAADTSVTGSFVVHGSGALAHLTGQAAYQGTPFFDPLNVVVGLNITYTVQLQLS